MGRATRAIAVLVTAAAALQPAPSGAVSPQAVSLSPKDCGSSWHLGSAPPSGPNSFLSGITSVGPDDWWAVGLRMVDQAGATLIDHFNGNDWQVVLSPSPGPGAYLSSVSGGATDDVWAVGAYANSNNSPYPYTPLIEHWDGGVWTAVSTPDIKDATLNGVVAISTADAWAVGLRFDDQTSTGHTLVEHWDGTIWSVVPSPDRGTYWNWLTAVAAASADDIWAVGYYRNSIGSPTKTLTERWDGDSWTVVRSPNVGKDGNILSGVAALPSGEAWSVGYGSSENNMLVEQWTGSSWKVMPTPSPGQGSFLSGVSALSSEDVWTVGYQIPSLKKGARRSLTAHWDGSTWTVFPSVDPLRDDALNAVATDGPTKIRAVGFADTPQLKPPKPLIEGFCPIWVQDSGFSPILGTAAFGAPFLWSFPSENSSSHAVVDNSGMRLFESGSKAPGTSYTLNLFAAGKYRAIDPVSSSTATVDVPAQASPSHGPLGTVFQVTWSTVSAPVGFVFDVQVERPGSGSFANLIKGTTRRRANFLADSGTGTYRFRARLRKAADGTHSDWSPPASIVVT